MMFYEGLSCDRCDSVVDLHDIPNVKSVFDVIKVEYFKRLSKIGRFSAYILVENSQLLFSIARQQLQKSNDFLLGDHSSLIDYKFILDLLECTRTLDNLSGVQQNLEIFGNSVIHATDFPNEALIKFLNGKSEISVYFHFYLDLLWGLFTNEVLTLEEVIRQLIFISFKNYERGKPLFNCICLASVWLRVLIFGSNNGKELWPAFNSASNAYDEGFVLNILVETAFLQSRNECGLNEKFRVQQNYKFLVEKFNLLNDPAILFKLAPLINDLWIGKERINFLYAAWDYFHRKIECVEIKGNLLELSNELKTKPGTPYTLFLQMLHKHFKTHPNHWNKFKGRIYTRFGPGKLAKLNETGIFNLALLYFALIDVNVEEINVKLMELTEFFPKTSLTLNIHIAILNFHLKSGRKIECEKLLVQLNEASLDRAHFNLISIFVRNLPDFFQADLNLEQHVFFTEWIENYSKSCQHSDLVNLLNALAGIFERIIDSHSWFLYEKNFMGFVMPALKRLSELSVELIGGLAALIAVNSELGLIPSMNFFSRENVHEKVAIGFFTSIAKNLLVSNHETDSIILKVWFQCGLIGETNEDFTKQVFVLDTLKDFNLKFEGDALINFIEAIRDAPNGKEIIVGVLDNLDKFVLKHVGNETSARYIYTYLAVVFNSCGKFLYNRASTTCFLSKFIDLLLLPMEILRGNKPVDHVLKAIEASWHLYLIALNKLNSDAYIQRVMKDLIVRYIPLFQKPPLHKITDQILLDFIFEKINKEFLLQGSNRSSDEHLHKVIASITSLVDTIDLKILLSRNLPGLYDVYLFKTQRIPVIDFLKTIIKTETYNANELNETIRTSLIDVAKKHLPFNTGNLFQMFYVLAKIYPNEIKASLPVLREEIGHLEIKRGLGFDNSLRLGYEKLQRLVT